MKKPTPKQWAFAVLVSLLITGSLFSLAMTYFIYLRLPSGFSIQKEDRWAIEQSSIIATNAFFGALSSGLVLGILLSMAYRWVRGQWGRIGGPP
jgi:hypothetical protein